MSDTNLPAILKEHPNALIFAKQTDFDTADIFRTEITVMPIDMAECHNISGSFVPNKAVTDRMADAAGIDFVSNEQTGVSILPGTKKYIGRVQGRKRNPDGTWRYSPVCEYEYDVNVRAEEDFLKDSKGKYSTETSKKLHLIELEKVARARADTGARLRAIRELIGMPTGFKQEQIVGKKLVFSRVAVDANRLLQDPEMRRETIKHALGVSESMFGPREPRDVTPKPIAIEASADSMEPAAPVAQAATQRRIDVDSGEITQAAREEGQADMFEDDLPWEQKTPADQLRKLLKQCSPTNEANGLKWLDTKHPTDAEIQEKIKRINQALDEAASKGGAG